MEKTNLNKYYDVDRIITYSSVWNMVITGRGFGKTYGFIKKMILIYKKTGYRFVYVRRYKTEMKETKDDFFSKVSNEFKDDKFTVKGNKGYINDKVICYFIVLSTSAQLKSKSFPNVKYIIFDEFIIENNLFHYLKNEVNVFANLFETIARDDKTVRAYLLGNNVNLFNPYFEFFNLPLQLTGDIRSYKNGYLTVDSTSGTEFINEKKELPLYKLMEGTSFYDFSINNQSLMNNNLNVKKRNDKNNFLFCIYHNDKYLGIWYMKDNTYYIDNKIMPNTKLKYILSKENYQENYKGYDELKHSKLLYMFKYYFNNGKVWYNSLSTKMEFLQIANIIGLK